MDQLTIADVEWIEAELLPKIAKFVGTDGNSVRCNITVPKNCFFASYVYFLDVKYKEQVDIDKLKDENTLRFVVKKLVTNADLVHRLAVTENFHTEILFYTKFASGSPLFPRCIYVNDETLRDTVIVLENLSSQGYEICRDAYDIPVEYAFAAINEIAKLHAMAYVMKEREPEKFHNIVSDIQDVRFNGDGWFSEFVNANATRPIDWLRRNNCEKEFCDKLEKVLGNAFENIMLDAVKPIEPLATLCHGDFTRNNIFFRKINGKLEAKLFDFALIMYSSPAIDLSTFLYLACSAKDRTERFEDLFRSYHCTLIEYLDDSGIEDLDKYSYDKMLADYKRRAAFGCMVAVFFLPITYSHIELIVEELQADPENRARDTREAGGEAMTEIFGKMIIELRELGSFDHLV